MYSVSLPTRRDQRAIALLHQTRDALDQQEWLTEEGLETARRNLLRSELERAYFADRQADAIGSAHALMGNAALGLVSSDHIEAVTLEQVRSAWETHIMQTEPMEVVLKRGKSQSTESELTAGTQGGVQ